MIDFYIQGDQNEDFELDCENFQDQPENLYLDWYGKIAEKKANFLVIFIYILCSINDEEEVLEERSTDSHEYDNSFYPYFDDE